MLRKLLIAVSLVGVALLVGNHQPAAANAQAAVFWNRLGSVNELANSEIGPPVQQISYKYSDWQEARIAPAMFGDGLYVNHDTREGWANDGANFFAIDMHQIAVTPVEGTIEFWFNYQYDSSFYNTAFFLMMLDQLAPHFPTGYPPQTGIDISLQWNGWSGPDRKFFSASLWSPENQYADARSAPWTAGPGGPYAFVSGQLMHFAIVWNVNGIDGTADTLRLYVNGALAAADTRTWNATYPFRHYLYIGSLPNRYNWDTYYNAIKGVTDDLIIYNYAKISFDDRFVEGPPLAVAHDDAYSLAEDAVLVLAAPGVLANDDYAAGLTPSVVSAPQHGSVALAADGSFSYTPAPNYHGPDSFGYAIASRPGVLSAATVALTITPVNDPPVANPDAAATDSADWLTIAVLANDSDIEGDVLGVVAVTDGANGHVTFDAASVTYTRNAGFNGSDSFTYTVSDGNGGTASGQVTVQLTPDLNLPDGVTIGSNVAIDPSASIGQGVVIGDNVTLAADVTLQPNAQIGSGSSLATGVTVQRGATIGADCTIGADSTIKRDVAIGDGATVGSDFTIDAGVTIGAGFTAGDHVKVNKDTQIGDNVTLGDNVTIGKNVTIGDKVTIGNGVTIAKNSVILAGSVIPG